MLFHGKVVILQTQVGNSTCRRISSAPALSPRAVEQRAKWDIPTDAMDYPVAHLYVDSLRRMGVKVFHTSRWFNGATVEMSDTLATKVQNLDFVEAVEMTRQCA